MNHPFSQQFDRSFTTPLRFLAEIRAKRAEEALATRALLLGRLRNLLEAARPGEPGGGTGDTWGSSHDGNPPGNPPKKGGFITKHDSRKVIWGYPHFEKLCTDRWWL